MKIRINNQDTETGKTMLSDILQEQHLYKEDGIAVAVNEEMVPRTRWNATPLRENDEIMVIGAYYGG